MDKIFPLVLVLAVLAGIAGLSAGVAYVVSLQLPRQVVYEYRDSSLGAVGDTTTARTLVATFLTGTTTLCSFNNTGSRDRWILETASRLNAASSTSLGSLGVATSSVATRSVGDAGEEFFFRTWPATSASSSYLTSATTSIAVQNGEFWRNIWPTGTFLNFYGSSSVDFAGTGLCIVKYTTDN